MAVRNLQGQAEAFLKAVDELEQARINFEKAKAEYDFARRSLILARDQYRYGWDPETASEPFPNHQELGDLSQDLVWSMNRFLLLEEPIREACRRALEHLGSASTDKIVGYLEAHGFEFTSSAPAREVHATLMRQPWARKNPESGEWKHIIEEE